ncbi:MAG: hypothetical protein AAGC68_08975 [Verrucomicrobiota bacterium]
MFRRVILEQWQDFVPYLCFALIAGAFAIIVWRALRMKKPEIDHLSKLPLEGEPNSTASQDHDRP